MQDMPSEFSRTALLLGSDALRRLSRSRVAVFGVGGVGGYALEVLVRSGVGSVDLFDGDVVDVTNLNRQIIALRSTVGQSKVDVACARALDINPRCVVTPHKMFYLPSNASEVDLSQFDYVLDCVDTMSAKLELVRRCHRSGVPLISSMGAANKLDATAFRVGDISATSMDPLARIMRKRLRKEGITHFKCVFSTEPPLKPVLPDEPCADDAPRPRSRAVPASNAWVPAAAGLVIASEVVKDLIKDGSAS